jgi:hypothetical protein
MDDDWYRANTPSLNWNFPSLPSSSQQYRPDQASSPMGCVEQWQWCYYAMPSPTKRECGPLAAFSDAISGTASLLNLTEEDLESDHPPLSRGGAQAPFMWMYQVHNNYPAELTTVLDILTAKSLLSQDRFYGGVQQPIPRNQWQLDVGNWFNTVLASIQASFVDTVSLSYDDPALNPYILRPKVKELRDMCQTQVSFIVHPKSTLAYFVQ